MKQESKFPKTILEFQELFQTEHDCEEFFFALRWPDGFRCPRCGGVEYQGVKGRRTLACTDCRHQTSVTAGTVLHHTKLPLLSWLWAIFFVARHKKGISATELQKDLGLGSYRTAWLMLHKIRAAFGEKEEFPLKGLVEIDETLIGAKGKGARPGRDLTKKSLVITAIEVGTRGKRGHKWSDVRAEHLPDASAKTIVDFVQNNVQPHTALMADALPAYRALVPLGYGLSAQVSSSMTAAEMVRVNPLRHVHLFFSNLKTWLRGRFHGVSKKYLYAYLNEFLYRLNRRRDTAKNFLWVSRRLMTKPHTTLAALKGIELSA